MIRVEGHKNLYRDEKSGAIVNCDTTSYNQYVNSLNYKDMQRQEIEQIKNDIDEIKSLLKQMLNKEIL